MDAIRTLMESVNKKPKIVFLIETLSTIESMGALRRKLECGEMLAILRNEECRGFIMFWRNENFVKVIGQSIHHIVLEV